MMIRRKVINAIIAQAQAQMPLEACGYLAIADGIVSAEYPLRNTDASGEHFTMDPSEQFATIRAIRANHQKPVAVWHSHPATPARPSAEDIRLAYDQSISYVIVSLAGPEPDVKSFRIAEGVVTNEPVEII